MLSLNEADEMLQYSNTSGCSLQTHHGGWINTSEIVLTIKT